MRRSRIAGSVALAMWLAGCGGFQVVGDGGGGDLSAGSDGSDEDAGVPDGAVPDLTAVGSDATVGSGCASANLPCLDPTPANVIEVPTEMTLAQAFASAQANDTIQLRGGGITQAGMRVPAYVTLRGCASARIDADLSFAGSGGVIEGFSVSASITANQTGSYVIRNNRFNNVGNAQAAGVSARSVDALVSATVTVLVEGNWFYDRALGIEALTRYDTMTHAVDLTAQSNLFSGVARPISIDEAGLVGKITARITSNTFYGFTDAVTLYDIDQGGPVPLKADLFYFGTRAVAGPSPFTVEYCLADMLSGANATPLSGSFASGDPLFADVLNGDFRLRPGSPAIDAIPSTVALPSPDFQGCPRPVAFTGTDARGDIGAIEDQQ